MVCTKIETTDATQISVVWGARNIGRIIGLSEGQTHYLLISGQIPGAIKRGNRWCPLVHRGSEVARSIRTGGGVMAHFLKTSEGFINLDLVRCIDSFEIEDLSVRDLSKAKDSAEFHFGSNDATRATYVRDELDRLLGIPIDDEDEKAGPD